MNKKIVTLTLFFILSHLINVNAQDFKYVEIFDPKQDKIVKVLQTNSQIQNMITNWIHNIQGIYAKNDPATDDGYVVKVPLDPPIKVNNKTLNTVVDEVYIVIPESEPPFFMIFEDKNKLCCYPFNGSLELLSTALDFNLGI